MVTTKGEGLHLVGILLRYMSKEDAVKMLKDRYPNIKIDARKVDYAHELDEENS